MSLTKVGTVRELLRYPVKSMAAEALESCSVSWHGFAGDRRWAFLRPDAERSGFPWFTIREMPDLWRYRPRFTNPADVEGSEIRVRTPEGLEFDVADPDLAQRLGDGVRVMKQYSGVFDTFPLSVLTVQSVASLSAKAGGALLTPLRFRPNIVIDTGEAEGGFPEDTWCGAVLRVGSLQCRLDNRDMRCMMVNVDPGNPAAPSDSNVLRTIARDREACFGLYGTTVHPGRISIADEVFLEQR